MKSLDIILASASPRRKELLEGLKLAFDVMPVDIDETIRKAESADDLVKRLSTLKASTLAEERPLELIIGADTIVSLDGEILGKPKDDGDAKGMLERLSGKTHTVMTGMAFILKREQIAESVVCTTQVSFKKLSSKTIDDYIATSEPIGKAGAYAIQGKGADLIESYIGSYTNIVGLPVREFLRLASLIGWDRFQWR